MHSKQTDKALNGWCVRPGYTTFHSALLHANLRLVHLPLKPFHSHQGRHCGGDALQ